MNRKSVHTPLDVVWAVKSHHAGSNKQLRYISRQVLQGKSAHGITMIFQHTS